MMIMIYADFPREVRQGIQLIMVILIICVPLEDDRTRIVPIVMIYADSSARGKLKNQVNHGHHENRCSIRVEEIPLIMIIMKICVPSTSL